MSHRNLAGTLLVPALLCLVDCNTTSGLRENSANVAVEVKRLGHKGQNETTNASSEIRTYSFEVVGSWPHDPKAFTQGLIFRDEVLYESTGLYGASSLRKVELKTGKILQKVDVPHQYFAEGLTAFRGRMFQLTWQSGKGFIYDTKSLKLRGEFAYDGEGWGITHDDEFLIMSDGTHRLRFLDPADFQVKKVVSVYHDGKPLMKLNELEFVKGEVYANIWQTDYIVRIDPRSGEVLGWIDLTGLLPLKERHGDTDVLNGIAYDEDSNRLFVTGKQWSKIFEITLKRK